MEEFYSVIQGKNAQHITSIKVYAGNVLSLTTNNNDLCVMTEGQASGLWI
jgi:hypothetical protein